MEEIKKAYVVAVNVSEKKGTIKKPVEVGKFIKDFGIENDAHAGNWHRQVSLLAEESIDLMIKEGAKNLSPGKFAENITTSGIELYTLPIGTKLKIGETVQEVTQIGKTCHTGCEISKEVGSCVMPKQGIFTKVLVGGNVKKGDLIEVVYE